MSAWHLQARGPGWELRDDASQLVGRLSEIEPRHLYDGLLVRRAARRTGSPSYVWMAAEPRWFTASDFLHLGELLHAVNRRR